MSQPKLLKVEPVESSELHLFYGNGGRPARPCGGGDRPLARRAGGVRRQAAGRAGGTQRPAPPSQKSHEKGGEKPFFAAGGCAIMAAKK